MDFAPGNSGGAHQWAVPFKLRCRSRLSPDDYYAYGRCDLVRGHTGAHALERGMEIVEFTTTAKTYLSRIAANLVMKKLEERGEL